MICNRIALLFVLVSAGAFADNGGGYAARVDPIFAKWNDSTPGCAIGVNRAGHLEFAKAYGSADLEHGVRNSLDTVFEAGSVSKQFTAMAVLMLARDGILLLDDPARKYIPELPDYGEPVTIREMLAHTSGLRDWGELADIGGWPRTTRVYDDTDILNIMGRQKELNFAPRTRWSYNNTGYNLAEIIVSRVSGLSLAEFTTQKIFLPLGMTHTSWRDDYTRIVPNRAIAYIRKGDEFHADMPFENTYGHGGLLTTVGDLLKWNEHLAAPDAADAPLSERQQQPYRLASGRATDYGLGLFVRRYKGAAEVSHTGSTAGYSAYLGRYPEQQLSIAALCNAAQIDTWEMGHAIADLFLPAERTKPPIKPFSLSDAQRARLAGTYRDILTGQPRKIVAKAGELRFGNSIMRPVSATTFIVDEKNAAINAAGALTISDAYGTLDQFERVAVAHPSPSDLDGLIGKYSSPEIDGEVTVLRNGNSLTVKFGSKTTLNLDPAYDRVFSNEMLTAIFSEEENGKAAVLTLSSDRVWNLRLRRTGPQQPGQP